MKSATVRPPGRTAAVLGSAHAHGGVTAILPLGKGGEPQLVWAGIYALNGNGEMTGSHWVTDGGYFVGPICITNTNSVGIVHHAAIKWIIENHREDWESAHLWAMPVVAETYDGVLNDINGQHLTEADALAALDSAKPGPVSEGNSGGGTGMVCYEFKGGTGTASRLIDVEGKRYVMGALVQANHGTRPWFSPLGVPVGRHMTENRISLGREQGSIIVVLGTDAPMLPHQLQRVARRAAIGVGRGGSPGGNNSGDIFLAFSVANRMPMMQMAPHHLKMDFLNDEAFDDIYLAAVEAVDEAVLNAMIAAEDMTTLRPAGKICRALDHQQLVEIMRRYGRCS